MSHTKAGMQEQTLSEILIPTQMHVTQFRGLECGPSNGFYDNVDQTLQGSSIWYSQYG